MVTCWISFQALVQRSYDLQYYTLWYQELGKYAMKDVTCYIYVAHANDRHLYEGRSTPVTLSWYHWNIAWQYCAVSASFARGIYTCSPVSNKWFPVVHDAVLCMLHNPSLLPLQWVYISEHLYYMTVQNLVSGCRTYWTHII